MSPTALGFGSFVSTVFVVVTLYALDVIPLWVAGAIMLAEGIFSYWLIRSLERSRGG